MSTKKKRSRQKTSMTINVRSVAKEHTKLNISPLVLEELRELTEDVFVSRVIRLSDKFALQEGKKTIQERDYIRAKDYVVYALKSLDNIM